MNSPQSLRHLRHHILRHHSRIEVELLVNEFGCQWEMIPGSNSSEKLQAFLLQLYQEKKLQILVQFLEDNPNYHACEGVVADDGPDFWTPSAMEPVLSAPENTEKPSLKKSAFLFLRYWLPYSAFTTTVGCEKLDKVGQLSCLYQQIHHRPW